MKEAFSWHVKNTSLVAAISKVAEEV